MYRFSIITPVHLWNDDRVNRFLKTIESVKNQTEHDFQWVVVDDGSTAPFKWDLLDSIPGTLTLIHKDHEERVIAYNEAFKVAEGEWFVLLDSDDELKPKALDQMGKMIEKYPDDLMFNFGAIYQHVDGDITFRDPFTPARDHVGHVKFSGGNIPNGTFFWSRDIYDDLGAYPPTHLRNVDTTPINYGGVRDLFMGTPYDFSAAAQLEFPEIREYFMVNHEDEPEKIIKELGNPWGQDYYLFYKYTRKYHCRPIKEYLYIVNPR